MEMHLIEGSKNIHSIGWTPTGPTLRVEFLNSKGKENEPRRIYDYEGVGQAMFQELMNSPSKGTYFSRVIKGRFPVRRIQ
jgi:hypothetical protein